MKVASIKLVVVDSSVALATLLPDEKSKPLSKRYIKMFLDDDFRFIAPKLLLYEVNNVMRTAVLRSRISLEHSLILVDEFENLPIITTDVDNREVLKIAVTQNMSFYDASYLWMALDQKANLLTQDERLRKKYSELARN